MSKEIKKFNSIEELNGFIGDGKIIYSLANSGSIWFVECETDTPSGGNTNCVDDFEALIKREFDLVISKLLSLVVRNQLPLNHPEICVL